MAFHTLPPVSSGISLLPQSSFLGLLPRRRFSSGNSLKLLSRKAPVRTALLEEVEAWRSTLQHYDPLVLLSPLAVIPVLVAIPRTTRTFRDSVCTRLQDFVAEVMALHNSGWGTVLTVLILGNAFYSDIAPPSGLETFENIPQELNQSGGDKPRRIQKPKSKKAENCTQKCLGTCIRGGAGSPGEGPFNVRRPLIVFKEGFRSRQYCLIECSEICNLIGDGDDGP
ncbi:hypothetical protein R1sor_018902 [Riccia sorocarpa]|uniref:Uncharacterized protein n=1 Tax=Riccia sorocarpa TaxID=122646 RepID=A0ABD3IET6_9MARC